MAAAKTAHQGQIGVVLPKEGDVARFGDPDLGHLRLIADRLEAKRRVRPGGCEEGDVMAVQP